MNGFSKLVCLPQIWARSFAPDHIGVRSVGYSSRDRRIKARPNFVEPLGRSFARCKLPVPRIDVACQERCAVSIGPCNDQGWNIHDISSESCSYQISDELASWHNNFAPHVPAFFFRRELIFKMNGGSTSF